MSFTSRYASLQEYHGLYLSRIRKSVSKIDVNRMQEHLMTNQADQRVPGRPGATPWLADFLVYLILQLNSKIQIAKTRPKQLSEKFENHPNKESFLQDFKQTKEINKFSGESQELIADVNNTEIFELCETSSKHQCLDCHFHWEVGIAYCTCGRCLRVSQSTEEVDKSNNDVVSIPGCVIKKKNKRGARHGPSERQRMYDKAKEMLHKARQEKHGKHSSILARWHNDYEYRKSLSEIGRRIYCYMTELLWRIIHTSQQELRDFEIQNIWVLKLNQDGAQQPLNQRPNFAQAKRECKRYRDDYVTRTQQEDRTIPRSQHVRQRKGQQFEGKEEYDCAVDPRTGWRFKKQHQGNLAPSSPSSSSTNLDRNNWTTRSWNSWHSSQFDNSGFVFLNFKTSFGWPGDKISRQPTGGVDRQTSHKTCLSTCSSSAQSAHMHIHSPREHAWLKGAQPRIARISVLKRFRHPCVMSHPLQHLSLNTSTLPHQSSSHSLPHSPIRWHRIQIPALIHVGVADPLESHLPHFTHATVDDSRRMFPRSVLQAHTIIVSCGLANFERTSRSMQLRHIFWGLRDELATAARKIRGQLPWSERRSFSVDDRLQKVRRPRLRQETGDTRWSKPEDHEVHQDKDYHELHSRLYDGMSRFLSGKNVVIMVCKNGRRRSVANAELWSTTLTRYGPHQHSVSLLHLSEPDFWKDACARKTIGMEQIVHQNLPDTLRLRPS